MSYYVYIIYSSSLDRYYVGHSHSNDLEGRLRRHNTNHGGFSGGANDWVLVYQEAYPSRSDGVAREREIKSWKSRKLIEKLVGGF